MSIPTSTAAPRPAARAGTVSGTTDYRTAFAAVTGLFFIWGFLTCLNDILIPHLKGVFDLDYVQAALVQFTFFGAYFLVALPSGWLIRRLGYKRGIVAGLVTAGVGALLFLPAANVQSYPLFLLALFVLASGITVLQVAANPYVTVLGDPATASSRLTLTQAFNSLGTTVAPLVGGALILGATVPGQSKEAAALADARAVQVPYLGIAIALFIVAGLMAAFKLPRISEIEREAGGEVVSDHMPTGRAWHRSHLALGVAAIFVYVGAEVSIGSFLVNFFALPEIAGMDEKTAAGYVSFYWGGAMIGRFVGSALLRRFRPGMLLGGFAVGAAALTALAAVSSGQVAFWAILAVGLCNSIMFPTIFALAIDSLGPLTGEGSSLLVMAIVGGALIPVAFGAMADSSGLQAAFLLPALCYLYIVFYGFRGSRVKGRAA
ncbi:FHS family L-fucose permease-like MFS transporter [Longimicrobium terrae]|uniref:FHS family L-fucose permease-like MFS transporter n=1 Tax=Longimicrobium terrae TaxID=1639882 RepID=A0A841H7S9_9BACT|nr:sugar MFS transporter [Longimicrobium terrae]MBB4639525.1 FHS family L-fucose permease-like MFS transporter [Longimicrobium terrae]MBB6073896.1 FHS family L-fucose permease-like MFS transporter [Longimicrobium terrae]